MRAATGLRLLAEQRNEARLHSARLRGLREDDERGPFKPRSRSAAQGLQAAHRESRRVAAATSEGSFAAPRGAPSHGRKSPRAAASRRAAKSSSAARSGRHLPSAECRRIPPRRRTPRDERHGLVAGRDALRRERQFMQKRRPRAARSAFMRTSSAPARLATLRAPAAPRSRIRVSACRRRAVAVANRRAAFAAPRRAAPGAPVRQARARQACVRLPPSTTTRRTLPARSCAALIAATIARFVEGRNEIRASLLARSAQS